MILNGVMALTLHYFNEFGKPAFQLLTTSSSNELVDQKSASVTQSKEVSVRNIRGWSEFQHYLLSIDHFSFDLHVLLCCYLL